MRHNHRDWNDFLGSIVYENDYWLILERKKFSMLWRSRYTMLYLVSHHIYHPSNENNNQTMWWSYLPNTVLSHKGINTYRQRYSIALPNQNIFATGLDCLIRFNMISVSLYNMSIIALSWQPIALSRIGILPCNTSFEVIFAKKIPCCHSTNNWLLL